MSNHGIQIVDDTDQTLRHYQDFSTKISLDSEQSRVVVAESVDYLDARTSNHHHHLELIDAEQVDLESTLSDAAALVRNSL